MKNLKFLLLAIVTSVTFLSSMQTAQAQSDTTTVKVTLTAQEHGYIVAFMPTRDGMGDVAYIKQVARQLVLDSANRVKDSTQAITVTVTFDQVKRLYLAIGSQQERLAGFMNTQIKNKLFPQLPPALQQQLFAITQKSGQDTDALTALGIEYLVNFKL